MSQALNSYRQAAKQGVGGRELEASLLMQSAANLRQALTASDKNTVELERAVEYNRRLWTILATAVIAEDNPIPISIKQNIVNLTAFIMKKSVHVTARADASTVENLIAINTEIAAGLRGR